MSRYAKAIAALLTSIATWGITAAVDDSFDSVEWFGLLGAVAAVIATYAIPNAPEDDPHDPA